jgi:tRNA pseudouridine38-40 synthase
LAAQRYKLTLAYRGTHYHGWQRQLAANTWKGPTPEPGEGIPTIQETVAKALRHVVGHPVTVIGSSRTDSGVHAKGQLAHFDTDLGQIPAEGLRMAANHQLPDDILIRHMEAVPRTFDAIRSTISKRYQYCIWRSLDRNPMAHDLWWHRWQPLDVPAMAAAARHFVGIHDFTSFARPGHLRESTVREVLSCDVSCRGERLVIGIAGTGFLWNMIRIIVGTLVEVGMGRYPPDEIKTMLAARDRRAAGPTAPPQGLYLQWVTTRPEDSCESSTSSPA